MAITVDDLPTVPASDLVEMRRITDRLLAALTTHQARATAFVNENKLEPGSERAARLDLLRQWLEAGHDLGNHTYSHPDLQTTALDAYEADAVRGEAAIRDLLAARGRQPRWFRHPFTHTGPTPEVRGAFEAFLASRGYQVAPFSIETTDYVFDVARRDALKRGDEKTAERLLAEYVDHSLDRVAYFEQLARDSFGREVPQVLLVHANGTNAAALATVLERLRGRGYRFVSLEDALADEAWRTPDRYVGPKGLSWLHRFRVARGLDVRPETEPDPPLWVLKRYRAARAR